MEDIKEKNENKDSVMNSSRKYILLQNKTTVACENDKCYLNGGECKKSDGSSMTESESKERVEKFKLQFYNNFLQKHYKNLVILAAAGTSMDNGNNKGKNRSGLWNDCKDEIQKIKTSFSENEKLKNIIDSKDIEALLSYLMLLEKTDENNEEKLASNRKELEKIIKESCNLNLDSNAPHKDFLNKITARKNNDARVQLFTTNYDTLFEQAANTAGFVVIDGFSFTQPREFSGKWFDLDIVNRENTRLKQEESFISKVFHLYKLHGSVNWTKNEKEGKEIIIQENNSEKPLVIYPANEKYESSYEQPYFEMMSRFQQALRKEETLLIVIGFGFQDKHIKNVIVEAVEQNPSFQLLIVNYNDKEGISPENLKEFFDDPNNWKVKRNVNIVFDTFKNFTKNYPENKTYYLKEREDEYIQS